MMVILIEYILYIITDIYITLVQGCLVLLSQEKMCHFVKLAVGKRF